MQGNHTIAQIPLVPTFTCFFLCLAHSCGFLHRFSAYALAPFLICYFRVYGFSLSFFFMPISLCNVSLSFIPSCRKHDVLHIPQQKRISNAILPHIGYHRFYCVLCSKYATFIIIALVLECNIIIFIALQSNYSVKLRGACCVRQLILLLLASCRKHPCHNYIYEQPWKLC